MFDALSEKLNAVFGRLTGKGRLTERDVEEGLREVRLAMLEADVNFRVARDFVQKVRERAVSSEVLEHLSPGQQIVKIVNEELVGILGGESSRLTGSDRPPAVLMLVGLQGSGKTTTAAKLALHLKRGGHRVLLVAGDMRRPAAVEQLETLGRQLDVAVHSVTGATALEACRSGLQKASETGATWVILDTGGRLHIDDEMMEEMEQIKSAVSPSETLMVVDAMTGQDAVNSAQSFHARIELTGLIMTKLDGDARGGAALSITQVTGLPIKFIGTGERAGALEAFHPDRMASRILGMGDVLTLVERAQESIDVERAKELERKLRRATFNLDDFLEQLQQVNRMGPISQVLEMIPGFSSFSKRMSPEELDGKHMKTMEAIVYSMTPRERRNPEILNGSRRRRIAKGSGTSPQQVNQLLNQFRQMQKVMKQVSSGRVPRNMRGLIG
ncbi:MAG: signal recognition particle protein [Chloroflexota bacterium]|nr:signal recognition particle protein [Chloroflexota bacterium]MDE2941763.1 signal recognition particle protein [Chloroflexota bacterium]MDE3268488.1 signal recognition particle protein [Chloroflexota bacterium]